jgi:aspartyl/asparaginyl beta-hydroxylase (cupin superfamily)
MFYFPGLPQRPFYERDEFDWLPRLEAQVPAIRAELDAVLADGDDGFQPYVERAEGRPAPANPLLDDPSWSAFFLWKNGEPVAANAARCPVTMAALAATPRPMIANWSPMGLFSVLRPGTHIRPHHGVLNTRLICHLPLIVPPGCGIRVGAETREWCEGETLIFDDSFEHEAWNRGDATRVVLLFEVWRPEITADERAALTRIFELIDTYQGLPDAS